MPPSWRAARVTLNAPPAVHEDFPGAQLASIARVASRRYRGVGRKDTDHARHGGYIDNAFRLAMATTISPCNPFGRGRRGPHDRYLPDLSRPLRPPRRSWPTGPGPATPRFRARRRSAAPDALSGHAHRRARNAVTRVRPCCPARSRSVGLGTSTSSHARRTSSSRMRLSTSCIASLLLFEPVSIYRTECAARSAEAALASLGVPQPLHPQIVQGHMQAANAESTSS